MLRFDNSEDANVSSSLPAESQCLGLAVILFLALMIVGYDDNAGEGCNVGHDQRGSSRSLK